MAVFTKKTDAAGKVQYRNITTGKRVGADDLDAILKAKLDELAEGTEVPESADIESNEGTKDYVANEEEEGLVEVTLDHPLLVNGKVFKKGTVKVSKEQAADLKRMDDEHTEYERNLLRGHDRSKTHTQIRPQDAREY